MKRTVFILICLLWIGKSHSQVPVPNPMPQLVISPQLFQPLSQMESIQQRLNDLRTNAAFIANLGSFQKFASVIEQTRCSTLDLQRLIGDLELRNSDFLKTCRFELAFNTGVYRLAGISDFANSVLSGLSMEPGDRLSIMMEAMREFDNVQVRLLSLNKELEDELEKEKEREEKRKQAEWAVQNVY